MSRQSELARQAVQDLLSEAKSVAIFQRQVKVLNSVYLQLITTSGVVSFKVSGVTEPDTRITALTEPTTWVKMSKGRVVISNEKLAIEPPEKHLEVITRISDAETKRIEQILHTANAPIAPANAVTDKTAAVLTQDNQVCLWLQDEVAGASTKSLKQVQWTRNSENVSGVYGVLNSKIKRVRANQTNIDAVSVGVLNGHCVVSFRDSEHSLLVTNIVAMPTSFPQHANYTDRGKYYVAELCDDGSYKTEEITEEQMRTKLTDPRTLLNPAPQAEKPITKPTTEGLTPAAPAAVVVPPPAPVQEPEPERVFDTAENVSISETVDGTIVTEEVAPEPAVEPVAESAEFVEQVVEQVSEQVPEEKPAEAEPSFDEQMEQLITFLDDMAKACRAGINGVRSMRKRYKEEAKQLKRSAKESEEFVAMKAKLDKAIADKDKAVAQLNKIKSFISVE